MEVKNNNNNSILEIDDLEVIYKTDLETVKAVNGINLKIRKGETCGLVVGHLLQCLKALYRYYICFGRCRIEHFKTSS